MTDFGHFACRRYVAFDGVDANAAAVIFGEVEFLAQEDGIAFLTPEMPERELEDKLARITAAGGTLLSHIRML